MGEGGSKGLRALVSNAVACANNKRWTNIIKTKNTTPRNHTNNAINESTYKPPLHTQRAEKPMLDMKTTTRPPTK